MKRRTPRGRSRESSLPTPSRSLQPQRKPEWNAYLTDDAQYKLNQQQQLQRALQQMSTAHFSARSPAVLVSRRRREAARAQSSTWSTPQDLKMMSRERSASRTELADIADTGDLETARRLQFTDVSMDLEDQTPRRRATGANAVSFRGLKKQTDGVKRKMEPERKAYLQGELEVLEKMLWELETETERLSWQHTPQKRKMQPVNRSLRVNRTGSTTRLDERDKEREYEQREDELEASENGRLTYVNDEDVPVAGVENSDVDTVARLGDICYKSLKIGLDLAHRVDVLTKDVDDERRHRVDRDLKIEMLEQELRSTHAKCNYLEAKYQSVASQVDDMRESVLATEETIHRITVAFEYSQRRRGRVSNPSTPSKPDVSQSHPPKHVDIYSRKDFTPQKSSMKNEQQENWTPNVKEEDKSADQ